MIRSSASTSTSRSTMIRRPFALTTSIRPQAAAAPRSRCSGTIIAGTKPQTAPVAKPSLAIRLAPGEQQLDRNPVTTRRRGGQPRSRIALLDDPQLLLDRPPPASARINNLKASDMTTVSKDIHTDSQLRACLLGKAAFTGCIHAFCRVHV